MSSHFLVLGVDFWSFETGTTWLPQRQIPPKYHPRFTIGDEYLNPQDSADPFGMGIFGQHPPNPPKEREIFFWRQKCNWNLKAMCRRRPFFDEFDFWVICRITGVDFPSRWSIESACPAIYQSLQWRSSQFIIVSKTSISVMVNRCFHWWIRMIFLCQHAWTQFFIFRKMLPISEVFPCPPRFGQIWNSLLFRALLVFMNQANLPLGGPDFFLETDWVFQARGRLPSKTTAPELNQTTFFPN